MKKLSLLFFASMLSLSMFAAGETGKTKADAIPYSSEGIKAESQANVGKWYVVDLVNTLGFSATTGKTSTGMTDANIVIANPLNETAHVDVTAYVADNETSRSFTLLSKEQKTMNVGAGMLVRMGIRYVYLYIVMDVEIPATVAEENKIQVNVQPVESNSVAFIPVDYDWTNGTNIAKGKETWIKIDMAGHINDGETFKITVQNLGSATTTIDGGLATDCPATAIQEQTKVVAAGAPVVKELDPAMLSMMPTVIYIRVKADQPLFVKAEAVTPTPPAKHLFTTDGATEIAKDQSYNLTDTTVYKIKYTTMTTNQDYHAVVAEIINNGDADVEIEGLMTEAHDLVSIKDDTVWYAVSRKVTVPAHDKIRKEIEKSLLKNYEAAEALNPGSVLFYVQAIPNGAVSFSLKDSLTLENPCIATPTANYTTLTWSGDANGKVAQDGQDAGTQWWAVNIAEARDANADIVLKMTAAEAATVTVDIAAACELGEPTQSYTGTSATTTKTLSNALFKNAGDIIYIRVKTDKHIDVRAEWKSVITWDGDSWSNGTGPSINDAALIEGDLTINSGKTIEALGLTMTAKPATNPVEYYTITIKNGGKLIVGAEGIKGSENIGQIIIEEGGILWIDPAATTNNKPFVTVKKNIELGLQTADGHTLNELHDLIALPIDNREAGVSAASIYYAHWDRMAGWIATDKFRNSFVGYNVYIPAASAAAPEDVPVEFKGQLAANKNITLNMPANGWYAFGNSWTAPIALSTIYSQLAGNDDVAVHFYVASPTDYSSEGLGTILDNYYIPATAEIASHLNITEIKPMQGFFLHTESSHSVELNYANLLAASASPAPKRVADNRNMVAAVLSNGTASDFVYMIEGEAGNAHKMAGSNLAIYAEDGLAQVANDNLIGTMLTIQTSEETEYTLHFTWLKGETMYLKDLENNNIIAMTAENQYTFTAEPNTVSERFQIIGRYDAPTGMENNAVIEGANKRIENGRVIIIKNGVKYDVLGSQL